MPTRCWEYTSNRNKVPTVRKPAVQASTVLMALYSPYVSELFLSS